MIDARVTGLPALKAALMAIPDKLRKRALRNALAAGARVVRDDARSRAPVLSQADALRAPFRTPGTVKRAIVVRTSKQARRAGDVGVFVNVRPAKAGQRGAKSKADPFYWRWLEFGSSKFHGVQFLQQAAKRLPDALAVFLRAIGPAIAKIDRRQTP